MTTETLIRSCTVQDMEPTHESDYLAIRALAAERAAILADLESVTNDIRVKVQQGAAAGWLSELRVSTETGISRSTIRAWLGKT